MSPTPKQTKEELLVENAILKYNEQVRLMLKQELAPFSEAIKTIEKRLSTVESEVSTINDVIEPLNAFRKRLWYLIIVVSLTVGVVGDNLSQWLAALLKK